MQNWTNCGLSKADLFWATCMRVEAATCVLEKQLDRNRRFEKRFGYRNEGGELQAEIFLKELQLAQAAVDRRRGVLFASFENSGVVDLFANE
jgi:hypothetical protein